MEIRQWSKDKHELWHSIRDYDSPPPNNGFYDEKNQNEFEQNVEIDYRPNQHGWEYLALSH